MLRQNREKSPVPSVNSKGQTYAWFPALRFRSSVSVPCTERERKKLELDPT